jgi:hypothetical protein
MVAYFVHHDVVNKDLHQPPVIQYLSAYVNQAADCYHILYDRLDAVSILRASQIMQHNGATL